MSTFRIDNPAPALLQRPELERAPWLRRPAASIVVVRGDGHWDALALTGRDVLGRASSCNVFVSHASVAREQAVIEWRLGRFAVSRRDSAGAFSINGIEATRRHTLWDGDVLVLGANALRVVYREFAADEVVRRLNAGEAITGRWRPNGVVSFGPGSRQLQVSGSLERPKSIPPGTTKPMLWEERAVAPFVRYALRVLPASAACLLVPGATGRWHAVCVAGEGPWSEPIAPIVPGSEATRRRHVRLPWELVEPVLEKRLAVAGSSPEAYADDELATAGAEGDPWQLALVPVLDDVGDNVAGMLLAAAATDKLPLGFDEAALSRFFEVSAELATASSRLAAPASENEPTPSIDKPISSVQPAGLSTKPAPSPPPAAAPPLPAKPPPSAKPAAARDPNPNAPSARLMPMPPQPEGRTASLSELDDDSSPGSAIGNSSALRRSASSISSLGRSAYLSSSGVVRPRSAASSLALPGFADRLQHAAHAWNTANRPRAGLLNELDTLRAQLWVGVTADPLLRQFTQASVNGWGQAHMRRMAERQAPCSGCKKIQALQALAICSDCDSFYCMSCTPQSHLCPRCRRGRLLG